MALSDEMGPQHEGTTIQRLDRLEAKVDDLADKVATLTQNEAVRRSEDRELPARVRRLEDQLLVWNTRWQTVDTMLARVFGVSVIGAVASIIAIIATIIALVGGRVV